MTFRSVQWAVLFATTIVALVVFGLLAGGLPWAYGGVESGVQAAVSVVLIVGLSAVVIRTIAVPVGSTFPGLLTLLPVGMLIALAGMQLSGGLVPASSDGVLSSPQTVNLLSTRLALAGFLAVAAAALIGSVVASREPAFHLVLVLCLVAASAVAFGGIALRLTGDDRMIRGIAVFGDPFARFVNRNNAAAFLQLGVAAGLALLRSAWRPDPASDDTTLLARGWRSIDRPTLQIVVGSLLGLVLAGVVASKSRGGILAAAGTVAAAVPFFPILRSGRRLIVLAIPVAMAAALLTWLGLSAATVERFRSVSIDEVLTSGRLPHWIDATHAMAARPWYGAGLGTYGYAYQQHSGIDYENWYEHADNQYVELAVEAGIAGGVALVVALVLSGIGLARGRYRPVERVLIGGVVAGQAVHAVFDYGIVVPAVSLTAAVLWSAGLTRLQERRSDEDGELGWSLSIPAVVTVSVAAATAAGLMWSYRAHSSAEAVHRITGSFDRAAFDRPGQFEPDALNDAIARLSAVLEDRPDDAVGHLSLGDLYVYRYRTTTASRLADVDPTLTPAAAWDLTRLSSLHRTVNTVARSGASEAVSSVRRDPLVAANLTPAWKHYRQAADANPRLSAVWIPLADLAFLGPEGDARGTAEIETLLRLFPADARLLRSAGRLAWQAGDSALASRCWLAAFTANDDEYWDYAQELSDEVDAGRAVTLTCPADAGAILRIATNHPLEAGVELKSRLGRRLADTAETLPEGIEKQWASAVADRLMGRFDAAEEGLAFLAGTPADEAALHAELARLHWDVGRRSDAVAESVIAAAMDARFEDLRRQMEMMQHGDSLRREQPVLKRR